MKPVPKLDFAFDRASRRRWRRAVFALLGLAFGLQMGIAAWRFQSIEGARMAMDSQQRQLLGKNTRNKDGALSDAQRNAALGAQAMINSLSVPWESLLGAIEAARTNRVVIDTIQPRAQDGSVSISMSCPDFASVAEFIGRLSRQDVLYGVTLVSEALPESGAGPLRVVISANWRKLP